MCSYNKVNQTQACQNSKILNGLLKVRACAHTLTPTRIHSFALARARS